MGVHGLWKLLEPAGKPVPLETLENKVLAVDVSIWLYQLTKGFQTTGGGIVPNAHILGLFNRICKLLYYRIKPVFVFDGGVPVLKKETIEARKRQKLKAQDISERLRERLLDNLLKQKAVRNLLGSDDLPSASRNNENDIFALPPMPEPDEDEIEDSEEEASTEISSAKVDSFCDYHYGKDVHSLDISSEQFKSLPPEIRHEILSELLETRKQNSWARIHEMPDESNDFSKYQMERLVKRRNVQRSLDMAAKEMGGRMMTMGELEELFHEQGIVTDSLPGRRIAADNVTRYVLLTGGKGDKNKPTDGKSEKSKPSETSAEIPSTSTEAETDDQISEIPEKKESVAPENQTPIKSEIDENEFRESVYAIDQCMFVVSSSSDEELEKNEDFGRDYAKKLSMEEKMSQEEILRLIKQQNSSSKEYPRAIPSTSSMIQRPYSDHSDVEDDPDPVAVPSTSGWSSSSRLSPEASPPVASVPSSSFSTESKNFQKSMTKLDKLINAVRGKDSDESSHLKSEPETNTETASVKSLSESDSESGFIEVTDESPKSQYFPENKSQTIEIPIDLSGIEDDLFADVFEPVSVEEHQKSEVEAVEIPNESSAVLEGLVEPLKSRGRLENESSESSLQYVEKIPSEVTKTFDDKLGVENHEKSKIEEISPVQNMESRGEARPKSNETSLPSKSPIDEKTKERVQKIAEIFNRVRKKNESPSKVNKPVETNESVAAAQDEKVSEVQRVLNYEHAELMAEHGKQERLGSTITQQMIMEAQELLQLFGLPYLIAPMEAEAQCAFLDKISLTEGTITDDSDIWLFGGQKVYKNFFDNRKYVLQFRNVDIEHFFRLTREQLIQMAMLVGSDYTVGIEGIGPVTAMEILAYFTDKSNKPETEADIAETLRSFKRWVQVNRGGPSALGKKVKNVRLSEGFPNEAVIDAYLFPTVNESNEGFSWAPPDLDRIREYMKTKFGWKTARIDEILLPVMKRQTERNKQTTLDSYFQARPYYSVDATNMSKRVVEAINIMKNKVDVDVSQLPAKSPRKKRAANASRATKKPAARPNASTRGGASASTSPRKPLFASPAKATVVPGQEFIPQREKDRLEAAKRKLEAVKIFRAKRKTAGAQKKRKVLQPKKDSSYLSESSSGSDDD